jgi:hypothetical protein
MALQAQKWTISGLATEFGISHRVLGKRLEDCEPCEIKGRSKLYKIAGVAPAILKMDKPDDLDLTQERARLAKAQADKTELQLEVENGNLLPVDEVESVWSDVTTAIRAKLLSLPTRISPQLQDLSQPEMESVMQEQIYEALEELSETDMEQNEKQKPSPKTRAKRTRKKGSGKVQTTTKSQGQ